MPDLAERHRRVLALTIAALTLAPGGLLLMAGLVSAARRRRVLAEHA